MVILLNERESRNLIADIPDITLLLLLLLLRSLSSSSYYWASVANAPNVLQPYWFTVLPLDVPDLTASLLQ